MKATPDLFHAFAAMHDANAPLILTNVWDAGSAKAAADAGAQAIGTSSWAVAASHGYTDREALPFELVLANAERIVRASTLTTTIDVERGYGVTPAQVAASLQRLADVGVVGCNLEDGMDSDGVRSIDDQAARIAAARSSLAASTPNFFINARTDIFLVNDAEDHHQLIDELIARIQAFANAGANGIFAPGLRDRSLIETAAKRSALPLNIMCDATNLAQFRGIGVARISMGPAPYFAAMKCLVDINL